MSHSKKLALAAVLGALAIPSAASADSLVYVKGGPTGNVFAAHPDGSGEVQLTNDGQGAWPSIADNGTIAYGNANDGHIYVLAPNGAPDHSMTTQGTYQFPNPQHIRISPDGTKIAYDILLQSAGEYATYWTPTTSTNINDPNQSLGQQDYGSPSWYGGDHLVLTHVGDTIGSEQQFAYYHTGDADNNEVMWFSDTSPPFSPTGWDAAISRDGNHVAVMENDAANYSDANPRNVVLRVFQTTGGPPNAANFVCQINVGADGGYYRGSPAFSPDGSQLAWSQTDGVHEASASDCGGARLVIPGANQPYWGAANPPVIQNNNTNNTTTNTNTNTGNTVPLTATISVSPKKPKAKKTTKFGEKLTGGVGRKMRWSFGDHKTATGAKPTHKYRKAGKYKVKLTLTTMDGRTVTATKTIKVSR